MENYILKKLEAEEYHRHQAKGSTQVKALKNIVTFLHQEEHSWTETPVMHRGTLIHAATLEALKEELLALRHPHENRAGWKKEDHQLALRIAAALRKHPLIGRILKLGDPEVSAFATLEGVECKARIDWYQDLDDHKKISTVRGGVPFAVDSSAVHLYDLKTVSKGVAEQEAFSKYVGNYGLHVQAALYYDIVGTVLGSPPARFSWIAVERDPPHLMAVHAADDWLEIGRREYRQNLQNYRDWMALSASSQEDILNSGYSEDERVLPVPGWLKRQDHYV
jgi:hypothetical protein